MYLFDNNLNKVTQRIFASFLKYTPSFITPSHITWSGFALACIGFYYFIFIEKSLAGFLTVSLLTLIFDLFDGMLARFRNTQSFKGKVEDSLADGLVNILFILGLNYFFTFENIFVYLLIWLYLVKFILVLLKKDRELGGGRASFLIAVITFNYIDTFGFSFENILCVFVIWNLLSLLSPIYSKK